VKSVRWLQWGPNAIFWNSYEALHQQVADSLRKMGMLSEDDEELVKRALRYGGMSVGGEASSGDVPISDLKLPNTGMYDDIFQPEEPKDVWAFEGPKYVEKPLTGSRKLRVQNQSPNRENFYRTAKTVEVLFNPSKEELLRWMSRAGEDGEAIEDIRFMPFGFKQIAFWNAYEMHHSGMNDMFHANKIVTMEMLKATGYETSHSLNWWFEDMSGELTKNDIEDSRFDVLFEPYETRPRTWEEGQAWSEKRKTRKFDPAQPRHPKGTSQGGRWSRMLGSKLWAAVNPRYMQANPDVTSSHWRNGEVRKVLLGEDSSGYMLSAEVIKNPDAAAMARFDSGSRAYYRYSIDFESGNYVVWDAAEALHWDIEEAIGLISSGSGVSNNSDNVMMAPRVLASIEKKVDAALQEDNIDEPTHKRLMQHLGKVKKFDPAQPRHPKGTSEGGRWSKAMAAGSLWAHQLFHGSPHSGITRFDLSKVGTGEGNTTYGWGMYFAEQKGVGNHYATSLVNPNFQGSKVYKIVAEQDGTDFNVFKAIDVSYVATGSFLDWSPINERRFKTSEEAEQWLRDKGLIDDSWIRKDRTDTGKYLPRDPQNVDYHESDYYLTPKGELYEVTLPDAALEHMLDWDAPITQQPKAVMRAMEQAGVVLPSKNHRGELVRGRDLYEKLRERILSVHGDKLLANVGLSGSRQGGASQLASEYLGRQGVPGLRYLDQDSRFRGDGSRNLVIWDQKLLDEMPVKVAKFDPAQPRHPKGTSEGGRWSKALHSSALWAYQAFHGSPKIGTRRFDLAHVGSGEGAAAFGWGMYFADAPGVAGHYTVNEHNVYPRLFLNGKDITSRWNESLDVADNHAIGALTETSRRNKVLGAEDFAKAREELQSHADRLAGSRAGEIYERAVEKLNEMERIATGGKLQYLPGAVYKVEFPDDLLPRMLDWDAPLSKQPEGVKRAYAATLAYFSQWDPMGFTDSGGNFRYVRNGSMSAEPDGAGIYGFIVKMVQNNEKRTRGTIMWDPEKKASAFLLSHGVPGNKYLDQQSRDQKEGTRNFVIWDQSVLDQVKVLEETHKQERALKFNRLHHPKGTPWAPTGVGPGRFAPNAKNAMQQMLRHLSYVGEVIGGVQNSKEPPEEVVERRLTNEEKAVLDYYHRWSYINEYLRGTIFEKHRLHNKNLRMDEREVNPQRESWHEMMGNVPPHLMSGQEDLYDLEYSNPGEFRKRMKGVMEQWTGQMDSALSKLTLGAYMPEGVTDLPLYRGIKNPNMLRNLDKMQVGSIISDSGYSTFSMSPWTAYSFGGVHWNEDRSSGEYVLFSMVGKPHHKGQVSIYEQQVILPRNQQYRITNIRHTNLDDVLNEVERGENPFGDDTGKKIKVRVYEIELLEEAKKYDPRQPRDPSGVPTGGQWAARYSGKQGDWMREHKAKQKEFAKSNPKGLRYDAELTGERLPSEALVGYLKAFAQFQKQNAQQHGLRYGGSEDFVMGEGREFDVPEAPPAIKLGTPKECFSNAVDFIMQKDGLSEKGRYRYVEGYVMSPKLPMAIHHAWVEDTQTGLAIDPTLGWNPKARYYGVSFEPAYLRKKLVEHGYYGLFTGDVMVHDLVLGKDADYKYREQP